MSSRETAVRVARKLTAAGFRSLFAGGCVRDLLLGIHPHDFDIATDARPEQVQALFRRTVAVGAQFGVVRVLEDDEEFEVATFRSDGAYVDGRHPESVVFSSPEEDARRRDFTINGLFMIPETGEILDFVGGREDLGNRIVRAIGDPSKRFAEDRLRVLRAVRFGSRLDFPIEARTWDAVRAFAPQIHQVSAERVRDELLRILCGSHRVAGFDLLDRSGLLREILPEVDQLKGCEQPPQFHPEGDVFVHTRLMLELLPPETSDVLVLGVLFHDIGKPATFEIDETGRIRFNGHEMVSVELAAKILRRLRFSNETSEAVLDLVRYHMAFKDVQQMRLATLKRFLARPTMDDELELHRVDCTSSHGMLDNWEFLKTKREEFANEPLIPAAFVNGDDLIALGLKPGPAFKEILERAMTRQLEGEFPDRDAAVRWLESHVRGEGIEPPTNSV